MAIAFPEPWLLLSSAMKIDGLTLNKLSSIIIQNTKVPCFQLWLTQLALRIPALMN
jgi:hypothetical protein